MAIHAALNTMNVSRILNCPDSIRSTNRMYSFSILRNGDKHLSYALKNVQIVRSSIKTICINTTRRQIVNYVDMILTCHFWFNRYRIIWAISIYSDRAQSYPFMKGKSKFNVPTTMYCHTTLFVNFFSSFPALFIVLVLFDVNLINHLINDMTLFVSVRHYFIDAFQSEKRKFKKRTNYWTHGVLLSNYSTICIALGKWWSLCALPLSVCLFFHIFFVIRFSFQRVFYSLFAFFSIQMKRKLFLITIYYWILFFSFENPFNYSMFFFLYKNQFYQLSWFAWWAF